MSLGLQVRFGTDDLEHIIRCPIAHQLAERHIEIRQPPVNGRADAVMCMSEAYLDGSCLLNGPSDRDAVFAGSRYFDVCAVFCTQCLAA